MTARDYRYNVYYFTPDGKQQIGDNVDYRTARRIMLTLGYTVELTVYPDNEISATCLMGSHVASAYPLDPYASM